MLIYILLIHLKFIIMLVDNHHLNPVLQPDGHGGSSWL